MDMAFPAPSRNGNLGVRGGADMPCPHVALCDLPAVIRSRVALLLWQSKYCMASGCFQECRRFRIAECGRPIPAGMLPNGYTLGAAQP
jgi:hypothetical protein